MPNSKKALVYWIKDDKAGQEPLSNVAENGRFIGSVGPVRWSTDKKWYPARVLMISDDAEELEKREHEVALEILSKRKAAAETITAKRKRSARKPPPSVATEEAIARALGNRVPVPKALVKDDAANKKNKKTAKDLLKQGHDDLDASVLNVKKNLLPKLSTAPPPSFNLSQDDLIDDEDQDLGDDSDNDKDARSEDGEDAEEAEGGHVDAVDELLPSDPHKAVWCNNCDPCRMLGKFGCAAGTLTGIFKTMSDLFGNVSGVTEIQYLELLPIDDKVKTVELTAGSNIMISKAVKEELKVFYKNKPSPLLRETLFALYGENKMRSCNLTARGNKPGTFGLRDNVLTAVRDFVNRQVSAERKMKMSAICKLINKRAPEWRKPKTKKTSKGKVSSKDQPEVELSPRKTTPRKTTPLKTTPRKTTPRKTTPRKTTPRKATPRKTPLWETTPTNSEPVSLNMNDNNTAGSCHAGPSPNYGAPPSFGPSPPAWYGPSPSSFHGGFYNPSNYYVSPSKQSGQAEWQPSGWIGFNYNYNDQQQQPAAA